MGIRFPVDISGTIVGESPDCLLLSGTVVGENPDHVCWYCHDEIQFNVGLNIKHSQVVN